MAWGEWIFLAEIQTHLNQLNSNYSVHHVCSGSRFHCRSVVREQLFPRWFFSIRSLSTAVSVLCTSAQQCSPWKQTRLGSPVQAPCGTDSVAGSTRRDWGATHALWGSWEWAAAQGGLCTSASRVISAGERNKLCLGDVFWWLKKGSVEAGCWRKAVLKAEEIRGRHGALRKGKKWWQTQKRGKEQKGKRKEQKSQIIIAEC